MTQQRDSDPPASSDVSPAMRASQKLWAEYRAERPSSAEALAAARKEGLDRQAHLYRAGQARARRGRKAP